MMTRSRVLLAAIVLLTACSPAPEKQPGSHATGSPSIEECEEQRWFVDSDEDGFGTEEEVWSCSLERGFSAVSGDCDDTNAAVSPAEVERCDEGEVDEDCNGLVNDEDTVPNAPVWWEDWDKDGAGTTDESPATRKVQCTQPEGFSALTGDCDDHSTWVSPLLVEVCDESGRDEDCNGLANDEDPAVDASTLLEWFLDVDEDGFGGGVPFLACTQPPQMSAGGTDCDDTNAEVYPGAEEVCSGIDDDCDGLIDHEDPSWDFAEIFQDLDGDDFGQEGGLFTTCNYPEGWIEQGGDCNDASPAAFPGNIVEQCADGLDNDCDGNLDLCWADTGTTRAMEDAEISLNLLPFDATLWAVGDVTGDGFADLLVDAQVLTQLLDGASNFDDAASPVIPTLLEWEEVVSATSSAGEPVLVATDLNSVEVWSDVGTAPTLQCTWPLASEASSMAAVSTLAGHTELVFGHVAHNEVNVHGGVCEGSPRATLSGPAGEAIGVDAVVGDFDNDGVRSIAVASTAGHFLWDEPWITSTFPEDMDEPMGNITALHVADLDGDGADELLVAYTDVVNVGLLFDTTNRFLEVAHGAPQTVHLDRWGSISNRGDVDGDGREDFARTINDVHLAMGNEEGLITFSSGLVPVSSGLGTVLWDANGDGYDDIVFHSIDDALTITLGGPEL